VKKPASAHNILDMSVAVIELYFRLEAVTEATGGAASAATTVAGRPYLALWTMRRTAMSRCRLLRRIRISRRNRPTITKASSPRVGACLKYCYRSRRLRFRIEVLDPNLDARVLMGSQVIEAVVCSSRDALLDALQHGGNPNDEEDGISALVMACTQDRDDLAADLQRETANPIHRLRAADG